MACWDGGRVLTKRDIYYRPCVRVFSAFMGRPMKNVEVVSNIESSIHFIRGNRVMLDVDLANLYELETKFLTRAVRRNILRFPNDFMFQLTPEEFSNLRCQIGTSSKWGGRRFCPYAFTEQGVAMLSGILNSERAIAVNIEIMRTFVRLRRLLVDQSELAQKLSILESKCDSQFKVVFDAIRELMTIKSRSNPIGFGRNQE